MAQSRANLLPPQLRLMLVGRTGAGKSATGNTILGQECFLSETSMSSVTKQCEKKCGVVQGQSLALIDTPGWFDTSLDHKDVEDEVIKCMAMCSPGPHAFLLIIQITRFTDEQKRTIEMIEETFQENMADHTIIIFTHADLLNGKKIDQFISRQDQRIQDIVERFGRRFLAFNNKVPGDREQVTQLMEKLGEMLVQNRNRHFTNKQLQGVSKVIELLEEKKEAIIEESIKKIKKELKEKEECQKAGIHKALEENTQKINRHRHDIQDKIHKISADIKTEQENQPKDQHRLQQLQESLQREKENITQLDEKEAMMKRESEEELRKCVMWIQEEMQRRETEEREKGSKDDGSKWYQDPFYFSILKYVLVFMAGTSLGFLPTMLGLLAPVAPVGLTAQLTAFVGPEIAALAAAALRAAPLVRQCSIQ